MSQERPSDEELGKEFERLARPMIKFLNDYHCPHTHVIISTTSAELANGEMALYTEEYILD